MPKLSSDYEPSQTAAGRDSRGRFGAGNKWSQGNVVARKVAQFRARLFSVVSDDDFAAIIARLVAEAKAGESWAMRLFLQYVLGEPQALDALLAVEELEQQVKSLQQQRSRNA